MLATEFLTKFFSFVLTSPVDFFIIILLFFLFYNISFAKLLSGAKNKKYLSIAWISNFIIIPFLAFLIASTFVDNSSAVFTGLIIYLVAPCTDWFLGFTKLAKGDVEINSALLPLNLLSQIILLPVYLYLFTANGISIPIDTFFDVLIYWVLSPFIIAQFVRFIVAKINQKLLLKSNTFAEYGVLASLTLLVFFIFHINIDSLIENIALLPMIFVVIFIFFVLTYYLIKIISRKLSLSKKQEVSLTMSTSARNAPLMLAISLGLFPQETVIHLVLIIGMLVEFPHLITLTHMLKR